MLTNDVVSFEQLGPEISIHITHFWFWHEKLSSNDITFVSVILFSEILPKTISNDHKSLKISMPCDQ